MVVYRQTQASLQTAIRITFEKCTKVLVITWFQKETKCEEAANLEYIIFFQWYNFNL